MAAASLTIAGAVLRDLLGLPADTKVEDVYVEVAHPDIPDGCDIAPTFTKVRGQQRLKAWNATARPAGKPLTAAERQMMIALTAKLTERLRVAANLTRDYSQFGADPSGGTTVGISVPKRYRG